MPPERPLEVLGRTLTCNRQAVFRSIQRNRIPTPALPPLVLVERTAHKLRRVRGQADTRPLDPHATLPLPILVIPLPLHPPLHPSSSTPTSTSTSFRQLPHRGPHPTTPQHLMQTIQMPPHHRRTLPKQPLHQPIPTKPTLYPPPRDHLPRHLRDQKLQQSHLPFIFWLVRVHGFGQLHHAPQTQLVGRVRGVVVADGVEDVVAEELGA